MFPLADHPDRYGLANELHARPFPPVQAPAVAAYLAVKPGSDAASRDRDADRAHLIELLDRHGAPHPQPNASHYYGQIGRHHLKWESHTEFVTYTVFMDGLTDRPFDPSKFDVFPDDWVARAPGVRVTSALIQIQEQPPKEEMCKAISEWFVAESVAVSWVLDRAAILMGDFRIDPAGHMRFSVFTAPGTGRRRIGRIVQRICEIETYKSMSMFGLTRARNLHSRLGALDGELSRLVQKMGQGGDAASTLDELLSISAELEDLMARTSFRFGATQAYRAIVDQRIEVLREERFEGRQTWQEFMMRRYDPAMRTVESAERQLTAMAQRAKRAGDLLRTRVDVERSAQNQALLESMDKRAQLQLRLQETVEGLSVVAISYYAVSLASYFAYPLASWLGISKGMLTAGLTLPVVALVWMMVRRIRHSIEH
ncbi:DUF3422 family protein [Aliiroseovarius crassostreae]|uniref:DUF3422 family protein n=1 Tax=Aliiroseovarius crassostreae TaxID=154981 RepID=UPI0022094312|nr:DUF3422 domain-containing protein [Aliiroseovarius crassostreae]UWP97445.1 DUF3422 domain-containing protein [Aliiroseovarius crassostreae]UWQ05630.1 DUF3422 domain-containing protein [Aliiroseovarius crassostreae]